jgi:Photosynthesis system II assembly factor YCF48
MPASSRPLRRIARAAWASASLFLLAPTAAANGRFPAALQLVVDPGDPSHIAVAATYGLLESFDAGQSWWFICEPGYGSNGKEDPALGIMSGGTIIAGLSGGLSVAADPKGCAFGFAEGPVKGEIVADVSVQRDDPSRAVAITATPGPIEGGFGVHVLLAESVDGGRSWQQAGVALPTDFVPFTVDVAPSDPQRVYVSGSSLGAQPVGLIERSDDRGKSWERIEVQGTPGANVYIGAIDPSDPDLVYARVSAVDDTLIVSRDGGHQWKLVYQGARSMLGFALSPDGSKVALGGPANDLVVAPTSTLTFATASTLRVRCLKWSEAGLYACGDERDGFSLGLSADEGKTFTPIYHLRGHCPLECPSTSPVAAACGTDCDMVADAGDVDASLPEDEAAPEAAPEAAIEAEAEAAPAAVDAAADEGAPPPLTAGGGCGCVLGARGARGHGLGATFGLLGLGLRARSRLRRRAC